MGSPDAYGLLTSRWQCGAEATLTHVACTASLHRAPIEVEIGGALVRVHEGTDAQQLRIVLQALRA